MKLNKNLRHFLWEVSCENFIKLQPDRFILLDGKKNLKGTLYFCETILDAIACKNSYNGTSIYCDGEQGGFVVVTNEVYK
jgi:hypothetical protein